MKKVVNRNRFFSHFRSLISGALALTLILSCSVTAQAGYWYDDEDSDHGTTYYEDMQYREFDSTNLINALEDMEEACTESGNEDRILEDFQTIVLEFDDLVTQRSLNNLRYYNDVNNEEAQEIDTMLTELTTDLADRTGLALNAALNTEYYDILAEAINDPDDVEYYLTYEKMTQEQKDLSLEENQLVQQYDQACSVEYTYTDKDGKVWTEASLEEATLALNRSEITVGLAKARNEVMAPIFIDLVKNRNRQAQLEGFDNYAEYAYSEIYNRDYTSEDIKSVYADAKEYFAPASAAVVEDTIAILDYGLMDLPDLTGEEIVQRIGPFMEDIDPELMESFNFMRKYHLYDIENTGLKMDVGYTDYLYLYKAPIIFNNPSQNYYDISTMIHEFGHYNNCFHNTTNAFFDPINMDVAEIHSQGMEVLFFEYYDEIYEGLGDPDCARLLTLINLTGAVTDGCLYDEFQNIVYSADKDWTVDELNQLFYELCLEYGEEEETAEKRYYSWVDVSHTFQSPLYYISYATSALSALDIFTTSLTDRQKAIDEYMNLTSYGLGTPYVEMMQTVGMRDIFSDGVIQSIAEDTMAYSSNLASPHIEEKKEDTIITIVIIGAIILVALFILLLFCVIVAVIIIMLIKKKKKKKLAQAADTLAGRYPDYPE